MTSPVDDPVERVVMQVNAIYQAANLGVALAIGELVIRSFYDGDVSRWRNRGRRKSGALRRLTKHPKLPMSAGTLYRNIAMYEICERLGVWSWKHVCASHFRSVLPLAREEQARLLLAAEENAWSPRQLDHEVAAVRAQEAPRPSRGGRPRASALAKAMRAVQSCIASIDVALDSEDLGGSFSTSSAAVFVTQDSQANWILTGQSGGGGIVVGTAACIPLNNLTSNPVRWWWNEWSNGQLAINLPNATFCSIAGIWGPWATEGIYGSGGQVFGSSDPIWQVEVTGGGPYDRWMDGQCVFVNTTLPGYTILNFGGGGTQQLTTNGSYVCALGVYGLDAAPGGVVAQLWQDTNGNWWGYAADNVYASAECFPVPQ